MTTLAIRGLTVRFTGRQRTLTAVDGVDLHLPSGQVLGLVGESGSGKSTVARALVGLVPISAGQVLLDGEDIAGRGRRRTARRQIQMVFQDPYGSLDPRMTVGETIGEAVAAHGRVGRRQRHAEIERLLELVALDADHARRLPRELSGGQRQRVAIARALAAEPRILIADEVTSALDASVQGAILNLLRDLQARLGLTVLFISHNLAVVRYVSDVVAVMYLGKVVEIAATDELLERPQHPYTRGAAGRRSARSARPAVRLPVPHPLPGRPAGDARANDMRHRRSGRGRRRPSAPGGLPLPRRGGRQPLGSRRTW